MIWSARDCQPQEHGQGRTDSSARRGVQTCALDRGQGDEPTGASIRGVAGGIGVMRSAGFTLLEMLVALTIFSLAALALVRLQAVSARTSVDLNARTMAQIVARNIMVERLTDPQAPALGDSQGVEENAGRQWAWAQQVEDADQDRMVIITVRVDGGPGQSPAVLTFGRAK